MFVARAIVDLSNSPYTAYSWQRKRKNKFGDIISTTSSFATPLIGVHLAGKLVRVSVIESI